MSSKTSLLLGMLCFIPLFSQDVEVASNITMNNSTSSTVGNILKNGSRFIHNSGKANTFVGYDSGSFSVTGMGNSGFGTDSLLNISSGMGNSGIGFHCLVNNRDGDGNTALGIMALEENKSGNNNTAVGAYALNSNTGSDNIAIGTNAGFVLFEGDNNIYVGNMGLPCENGTIRIGTRDNHVTTFIQGIFGSSVGTYGLPVEVNAEGQLGTVLSSQRFKKNIAPMHTDSANLYKLRPVTFEYILDAQELKQYGLIAEEVAEVFPELVIFDEKNQAYAVRYQILPILLLNEVQQQYAMIQALAKRLEVLEARG